MTLQAVSPKAKTLWRIRNLIWLALITVGVAVALLLCSGNQRFGAVAAILGLLWLGTAALLLIWPTLKYKHYAYSCDEKRFYIRQGVIFRHQITAPVCQIQDLHFYEGPIMRLLGLGRIILSTGGSNFELQGMEKAAALALIEDMESKLRTRIEVQRHEEI